VLRLRGDDCGDDDDELLGEARAGLEGEVNSLRGLEDGDKLGAGVIVMTNRGRACGVEYDLA
jgi:hypothetical protein